MIVEGLEQYARGIEELQHHPDNPRRGNVDAIAKSLETFGQTRPIIALPDGTVVAGNHVLRAAKALGWETVAAIYVDLSDEDASAYLLADNRLSELGTYADEALADLLEQVAREQNLEGTGYTDDEVTKLLRKLRPDAPDDFPDLDPNMDTAYTCKSCGYQWS